MECDIKITPTVAAVLKVFLEDPEQPRYGFELMQRTKQPSGTTYPIMARLERAGWIMSEQEDIDPATAGRPRRRTYRLTPDGMSLAATNLAELSEAYRPPTLGRLWPQGGLA
ncbi:PadR family transcriptional regulator [Nonomuraea sp. NPDC001636]|uniref:PadR family transcriptional regulator n=1 Tax=Nonomuraea sp. NPDC001636 TaxID=3154391 RepID=UPI003330C9C5